MHVKFFQRKPYDFHFSIEKLFETIRKNLSGKINSSVLTCPYHSFGVLSRIKNIIFAYKNKGRINHITGDVHYLSLALPIQNTINTYHDFTFLRTKNLIKYAFLKLFWVTIPVKRSKFITVISEATKKELVYLTQCPEEKIKVIPNIIPSHFRHAPKQFNSQQPFILHIGTTPNKNIERLFDAIKGISCHLLIVGKLTPSHQLLLQKYDIEHTNYFQISEEQLTELYQQCDLLSFCSLNEGFGMPILEAQATGRPVITSNISSMPEVAGEAAYLVDPYNVESIKSGILKIINDTDYRANLIKKGLVNVKRFNAKEVARMYEEVYTEIEKTQTNHPKLLT